MKNSYRWSLSNLIASCIQRCKVSKSEFGSISIILYQSSDALSKLPNALSSFKVIIIVCVPGANERLSGFRILPTGTTEYLTPGSWARYTEYLLLAGCCLSLPSEVRCRKIYSVLPGMTPRPSASGRFPPLVASPVNGQFGSKAACRWSRLERALVWAAPEDDLKSRRADYRPTPAVAESM
jgi:hypothetical protein